MNWNDNGIACVSYCIVSGLGIVFVDFVVRNHGGCACGEFAL